MIDVKNHKRQLTIIMALLLFASEACVDIYVSGLPQMTKEFHTTISQMSMTISIYTYSKAVMFLFVGVLSDLYGRRKILLTCITVQFLASFMISQTHLFSVLIFGRVLQALGSASVYIVLRLVIKDVLDLSEQIKATSYLLIGVVLSPAIAPVVGALIINWHGWRETFVLLGVLQLIFLIWLFFLLNETNKNIMEYRSKFSFHFLLSTYALVLMNRQFLCQLLLVGGVFATFYSFVNISSYLYIEECKVSGIVYSFIFIGIAIAYLSGMKIMLWLSKHNTPTLRIIQIGICISLVGLLLMLLGICFRTNVFLLLWLTSLGAFLMRATTALINPITQVTVTHSFGEKGSYAIGVLSCFQFMFGGTGALFVSSLPFLPSTNLFISSLVFIAVTFIGYISIRRN